MKTSTALPGEGLLASWRRRQWTWVALLPTRLIAVMGLLCRL